MNEKFIVNSVIKWLKDNGWKISPVTYKFHGVDIKAYHKNGCQYLIECKGENKSPNVSYNECMGQIISRMIHKSNTNYYGIAFPDIQRYRKMIKEKLPDTIRKKLKLRIIFVNDKREVIEIRSSQRMV